MATECAPIRGQMTRKRGSGGDGWDMRPERIEFPDGMPVRGRIASVAQYPYHWHDALEIQLVLCGSTRICLGDDELVLGAGDIAVANMSEMHRIIDGQPGNRVLFVHIDPDFVRNVLSVYPYLYIYCCSASHGDEAKSKYDRLRGYVARLVRELIDGSHSCPMSCEHTGLGDREAAIRNLLTSMLEHMAFSFDLLRWGFGTEAFEENQVQRLRQIAASIDQDLQSQPRLSDLANELEISLHHLSHEISDKFGHTFRELLYYGKLQHAVKLLLSTDAKVIDIALECGFSDPKYLVKHLKLRFGHTPSEFRRIYSADPETLRSQVQLCEYPISDALEHLGPYLDS